MDTLFEKDQHIQFSGAGASHQNNFAKRGIQTVIQMARIMLIQYGIRSTQGAITDKLCPMSIEYAAWIYNQMPREDSGRSTYELYSRSRFLPRKEIISTCHTLGAPAYII